MRLNQSKDGKILILEIDLNHEGVFKSEGATNFIYIPVYKIKELLENQELSPSPILEGVFQVVNNELRRRDRKLINKTLGGRK